MTATVVATDGANEPQLKAVGRLNVNTATRAQLLEVPGLDAGAAEAILEARARGPISDLAKVAPIGAEARLHLKTAGTSNFYKILQLPLQRLEDAPTSSASRH